MPDSTLRIAFTLMNLCFAIYMSICALHAWNQAPIVTSVTHDSIKNVAFPAVTVCYPLSLTKGYSVTQALLHLDPDDQILDLLKDDQKMTDFKESINARIVKASMTYPMTDEFKKLVNVKSYKALENLMGEDWQEVPFLLHFLSYNLYKTNPNSNEVVSLVKEIVIKFNEMEWQGKNVDEMKQTLLDLICNASIEELDVEQLCKDVEESTGTGSGIDKYCQSQNPTTSIVEWCETCVDSEGDCLQGAFLKNLTQNISQIKIRQKFLTKNAIYDALFSYSSIHFDTLKELNEVSEPFQKALGSWYHFTGKSFAGDVRDSLGNPIDMGNHEAPGVSNEKLIELFTPSFHGDTGKGPILSPFCNFGSDDDQSWKACQLFEPSQLTREEDLCFTFNGDEKNPYHSEKLGPGKGFNFLLNFRLPRFFGFHTVHSIRMILHEPGTAPDFKNDFQSFLDLKAGKYFIIGVKGTNVTTNEQFNGLTAEKRKCKLDEGSKKYSQTECLQQLEINDAINTCQCISWYMSHLNPDMDICTTTKAICFEERIQNATNFNDKCLPECSYVQYSASVLKSEDMGLKELCIVNATYAFDNYNSLTEMKYSDLAEAHTIVKVNFDDPKLLVITKDAKVTIPDMVGSIGGTFGVFIGFSIVGFMDTFIEVANFIRRKISGSKKQLKNEASLERF